MNASHMESITSYQIVEEFRTTKVFIIFAKKKSYHIKRTKKKNLKNEFNLMKMSRKPERKRTKPRR